MPPKKSRSTNDFHKRNSRSSGTSSHHFKTRSSGDLSIISHSPHSSGEIYGGHLSRTQNRISSGGWTPGQEFSHIAAYDPIEDIIHAHKYITERRPLRFYQVFRYATFIDWILMFVGLILAVTGCVITPWLYYWAGVTMHDVLVFERCQPQKVGGVCEIKFFCGTTLTVIGQRLFLNIFFGWILYNAIQLGYSICFTLAADRQTKAMRAAYFESIVRKDMAWFDINADKDFGREMNEQITQIRLGIGEAIPTFVNLVCTLLLLLVLVIMLDHWVALSFLVFIPISMVCVFTGNWAESKRVGVSDRLFQQASVVAKESMVNIKIIKMYEGEQKQSQRFCQALDDYLHKGGGRREVKWLIFAAISSASIWLLLNLATGLVFWMGQGVRLNATEYCRAQSQWGLISLHAFESIVEEGTVDLVTSPGEILVVYFGLMYLTLHTMEVPNFMNMMKIAHKNASGVFFIIDWKSRIDNTSNEGKMPKRNAVGRLDFSNVTFRYPQKPEVTVLNIKQLTIFSGQYVAFAGPEDSGKNTILKLIPRLYDTCTGYIALDAVNVQNYNIHWLRRQMCIISEAPVIFSGTISENILFGKLNASEEEIVKACQLANVHHVIEKLPKGYNTIITGKEYGDELSRNEKRQVCLARAYLHRSRLILMDNPLQPDNDELEPLLLNFVHHFRDTATVILASSTVTALSKRADCIYYMEAGKIIESGNHIQLIQARGKYYSRLEDTMNCSVESRSKFDSQLKAYKFSQLLQKKRASSLGHTLGQTDPMSGGEMNGIRGSGDQPPKQTWKQMFKKLRKSNKSEDALSGGEGAEIKSQTSGTKSQILRKQLLEIASHEESYSQQVRDKKKSSIGGNHIHGGFGMMGFQRMNFARPMTNYSSQAQKQRKKISLDITYNFVGNDNLGLLRKKRLSLHPSAILAATKKSSEHSAGVTQSRESTRSPRSGTTVRFGQASGHKQGSNRGTTLPLRMPKLKKTKSNMKQDTKSKHTQRRPSNLKATASKSHHHHHKMGKNSYQAMLEKFQDRNVLKINENVELDNVSIESTELDSFLAEYDEAVSTTLRNEVKGYWRDIFFVTRHHWPYIIPGLLASIVLGISIPYQTWIVGTFFEALGDDIYDDESFKDQILLLIYSVVGTGCVTGLAAFVQEFSFAMAGRKMTRNLRETLFAHILQQDLNWFDERDHDIGILILQLYADVTVVFHTLLMTYATVMQVICNVITSMTFAGAASTPDGLPVTICLLVTMPLLIGIMFWSSQRELHEAEHIEERFRLAGLFAQEFLTNIKTWFSLGAEGFFISQHRKLLDKEYTFINLTGMLLTCLHSTVQTSSWLIFGAFIYFTLHLHDKKFHEGASTLHPPINVEHPTPLNIPSVVGFLMITSELLIFGAYRVGDQISSLSDVTIGKAAAHKIMRILVNQPETEASEEGEQEKMDKYYDEEDAMLQPPPEIGMTNVTYYYPGADPSLKGEHLHNICMTINSGSYVAIVGPPGSGKSTLCNIILRMCNPTSGILDFNGDDSRKFRPRVFRRLMGLVEYDPCLFESSILENIQFGRCQEETTKWEVEEATKMCNCHFDILDLPDDYETAVGQMERTATNFSLKQRISFARAMVRKPKILVVDDATTSVDLDSDHKLLQVIANVKEGRTLIVFSHKIEPVREADMIFVLWEGELVEAGTDNFLLNKKGYYYEMLMTQRVLADSMRNSPQQLSTIRYNIKKQQGLIPGQSQIDKQTLAEMVHRVKEPTTRKSSLAYVSFLDEKVDKMKAEKERRRKELEGELPQLEQEEKNREEAKRLNNKS